MGIPRRPLIGTATTAAAAAMTAATVAVPAIPAGAAIAARSEPVTVWTLKNVRTGNCLSQYLRSYYTVAEVCNGGAGQQWEVTGPANARTLKNVYTGQCLGLHYNRHAVAYDCDGGAGQQWEVTGPANARTLKNVRTGRCLSQDAYPSSGYVWGLNCYGRAIQRWSVS